MFVKMLAGFEKVEILLFLLLLVRSLFQLKISLKLDSDDSSINFGFLILFVVASLQGGHCILGGLVFLISPKELNFIRFSWIPKCYDF